MARQLGGEISQAKGGCLCVPRVRGWWIFDNLRYLAACVWSGWSTELHFCGGWSISSVRSQLGYSGLWSVYISIDYRWWVLCDTNWWRIASKDIISSVYPFVTWPGMQTPRSTSFVIPCLLQIETKKGAKAIYHHHIHHHHIQCHTREQVDYVRGLRKGVIMIGDVIKDVYPVAAASVGVEFGLSSVTTVDAT